MNDGFLAASAHMSVTLGIDMFEGSGCVLINAE